jgi:hypothetical protein
MIDARKLTGKRLEMLLSDIARLESLLDESYEKAIGLAAQVNEDGVNYLLNVAEFAESEGIDCIVEPESREEIVPGLEPQINVSTFMGCRLKHRESGEFCITTPGQDAYIMRLQENYESRLKEYRGKIRTIGRHCEIYYRKLLESTVVEKIVDAGQDDTIIAYLAHPDKKNLVRMTLDVKNFSVEPSVKNSFFSKQISLEKLRDTVGELEESEHSVYYIRNFSGKISAGSVLIYVLRELRKEKFGYAVSGEREQVLFDNLKEETELRLRLELAIKHAEKGEPN